jgi:hypothetical protein
MFADECRGARKILLNSERIKEDTHFLKVAKQPLCPNL